MEELLKSKLKTAIELKKFTTKIRDSSLTPQYDTVNTMLDERQKMIDNINSINEKINNEKTDKTDKIVKSKELINIDKEIKEVFTEIVELDNLIRKNIINSLKDVKEKLNHPQTSKTVNIKA